MYIPISVHNPLSQVIDTLISEHVHTPYAYALFRVQAIVLIDKMLFRVCLYDCEKDVFLISNAKSLISC